MSNDGAVTNVVVTCSHRKRLQVPHELRVRNLPRLPFDRRVGEWLERLKGSATPVACALDLYAGEHWSVARSLPKVAAGQPVHLWILSAGYGLISGEARIHAYAATFAPGHPDSVGLNGTRGDWWSALAAWSGPEPGSPRSLAQLARQDPGGTILVALSPPYLDACSVDLTEAAASLDIHERLSVICVGGTDGTKLKDLMLPGDARLQHELGGSRQALNVRVLAHLLREHQGPMTRIECAATIEDVLSLQPNLVEYDRKRCSDAEVAHYIRNRLEIDQSISRSRLLREFRDDGFACEQSRFGELFNTANPRP